MGYTVEISLKVKNNNSCAFASASTCQEYLKEKASEYNSISYYILHDIEGEGRKIRVHNLIFVAIFDDEDFSNLISFISEVKEDKMGYIECIYKDEVCCKMLFISPRYLKKINKEESLNIRRKLKKDIDKYPEIEILNDIIKGKNK